MVLTTPKINKTVLYGAARRSSRHAIGKIKQTAPKAASTAVIAILLASILPLSLLTTTPLAIPKAAATETTYTFGVVGDYGQTNNPGPPAEPYANKTATLIKSWSPDLIITVGDNSYNSGTSRFDNDVWQFYHDYIYPYSGSYGSGAASNKFWPSIGNHDYNSTDDSLTLYTAFFTLPNNERYYELVSGPVHFFAINSDDRESNGNTASSTQGTWLRDKLANSTSPWNIVYFHEPYYSSGGHTSDGTTMNWPFKDWGASAVFTGHDHVYERLEVGGIPYFVNGLGGDSISSFGSTDSHSQVRYNGDYGAQRITANSTHMTIKFVTWNGTEVDSITLTAPAPGSGYTLRFQGYDYDNEEEVTIKVNNQNVTMLPTSDTWANSDVYANYVLDISEYIVGGSNNVTFYQNIYSSGQRFVQVWGPSGLIYNDSAYYEIWSGGTRSKTYTFNVTAYTLAFQGYDMENEDEVEINVTDTHLDTIPEYYTSENNNAWAVFTYDITGKIVTGDNYVLFTQLIYSSKVKNVNVTSSATGVLLNNMNEYEIWAGGTDHVQYNFTAP